jgi:uncharacterized protein YprB with RNaseH-like and TPR domain
MVHPKYEEVARILRERLDALKERDGDIRGKPKGALVKPQGHEQKSFSEEDVEAFKREFLERFGGMSLEKALEGSWIEERHGLLTITHRERFELVHPGKEHAYERLARALWLVAGIRDTRACELKGKGIESIFDLANHSTYGALAREICSMISQERTHRLYEHICTRGGRAHILSLALAPFFRSKDVAFLDIEAMGLFGGSLVMAVGLGMQKEEGFEITQFLAKTPDAEEVLIGETCRTLQGYEVLVTFNGRAFDVPFIAQRAAFYGVQFRENFLHFDILHISRRIFKEKARSCKLQDLAIEVLGEGRDSDLPGALVPRFYQEYMEDPQNKGALLVAILRHNKSDVLQMAKLYNELVKMASLQT